MIVSDVMSLTVEETGVYTLEATIDNDCEVSDDIAITVESSFQIESDVIGTTCGLNNGRIELNINSDIEISSYSWNNNLASSPTQENLAAGTYTVNITSVNGCSTSATYELSLIHI